MSIKVRSASDRLDFPPPSSLEFLVALRKLGGLLFRASECGEYAPPLLSADEPNNVSPSFLGFCVKSAITNGGVVVATDASGKTWQTCLVGAEQAWVLLVPNGQVAGPVESPFPLDSLTGLPQRSALDGYQELPADGHLAILFIDLDGFKAVNDLRGHQAGDAALRVVARRLSHCLRSDDILVRYGGDEFVGVLPGIRSELDLLPIVDRLNRAAEEPFCDPDDGPNRVSASIGIALASEGYDSLDTMIAVADQRMYEQKRQSQASAP